MARNRKTQSAELRFGSVIKALLICFFIGGAGIGYVYQQTLLNQLGEEMDERERELRWLQMDNAKKTNRVSQLNSPRELEERVRRVHPDLVLPSPSQVVVLVEKAGDDPVEDGQQYAQGRARGEEGW